MYIQNGIGKYFGDIKAIPWVENDFVLKIVNKKSKFFPFTTKISKYKTMSCHRIKRLQWQKKKQIETDAIVSKQEIVRTNNLHMTIPIYNGPRSNQQTTTGSQKNRGEQNNCKHIHAYDNVYPDRGNSKKVNRNVLNAIPIQVLSLFLD